MAVVATGSALADEETTTAAPAKLAAFLERMAFLPRRDERCRGRQRRCSAIECRDAPQKHIGNDATEWVLRDREQRPQIDARREADLEEVGRPRNQRGNRKVVDGCQHTECDDRIAPSARQLLETLAAVDGVPVDLCVIHGDFPVRYGVQPGALEALEPCND